jgi:hypothetical protein
MSSARKPLYMADYGEKNEVFLTIFSEVPKEKSLEEIRKEFEKIRLFGYRFKSMQEVVWKPEKKGGDDDGNSKKEKKILRRKIFQANGGYQDKS